MQPLQGLGQSEPVRVNAPYLLWADQGQGKARLRAVDSKIDLSWIDLRSISVRFVRIYTYLDRSCIDRSQFTFERSHSDRFRCQIDLTHLCESTLRLVV